MLAVPPLAVVSLPALGSPPPLLRCLAQYGAEPAQSSSRVWTYGRDVLDDPEVFPASPAGALPCNTNWSVSGVPSRARDGTKRAKIAMAEAVASLQSGQTLRRFEDRYISPTLVDNLVDALLEVAAPDFTYRGTLHIVGSERITDYAYARCLAHALRADERQVVPERIADSPSMAHTPRDASLDCAFTQSLLRTRLLSVREQMAALFPDS